MKFLERMIAKIAVKKIINRLVKFLNEEKMKSTKTTIAGIIGAIGIIATQVWYSLDADPETVISMEAIFSALTMLGIGWFARDNDKSSEQVGAK